MKAKTYAIKYSLDIGEFTPEQLEEAGAGGCDTIGIISVMGTPCKGGALSTLLIGKNPDGTDWDDDVWYLIFTLMASKLTNSKTLSPGKKLVAESTFEMVQARMGIAAKDEDGTAEADVRNQDQ